MLSVAQGSGSRPDDPEGRRLGGYLMFCAMASLAVSSALWMTATSANPIGIQVAQEFGLEIGFGKWLVAASVPALTAILLLPLGRRAALPARRGRDARRPGGRAQGARGAGIAVARRADHRAWRSC